MMMSCSWLRSLLSHGTCTKFLQSKSKQEESALANKLELKNTPRGWKCMPYIIGNETFEKLASFGLTANLTVYLVKHFNIKQVEAANMSNIFFGATNFAPLLGAFISDAYLGRFLTLAFGSIASLLGMMLLTITASVRQLQPHCDSAAQQAGHCKGPSVAQVSILFLSLVLLCAGAGGVRPCSLPFGVDQFDQTSEKGQRGLNSYFNWYYGTTTAALMLSLTVVVYIQDNVSFIVGFAIPTGFMLCSIILFFLGTRLYVHVPPEGSVFSGIAQVFVASCKKRNLLLPSPDDVIKQEELLYDPPISSHRVLKLPLTLQYRFLNKAAIVSEGEINQNGYPTNSWRLCSVQQIEEVKCLIRIIPIWFSGVICFLALAQQWSFGVLQGLQMDRRLGQHFEIPPGTLISISMLSLTLLIPIYDKVFVPLARRFTKIESGITLLQRQGIGIVISSLSMVVAGLVEHERRSSALAHGGGPSPMSALWLAPQLILMGVAEAFNAVGQIEFYNRQFPEHMQTLAGSLFFCSLAGSNYLSSLLVSIVRRATAAGGKTSWLADDINAGRVDYYYYMIAILGVVDLFYFLVCAHYYRYKGTKSQEHQTNNGLP